MTTPETPYAGRRLVGLVALLGALTALGPLTIDTYLPALPTMVTDLHASQSSLQATVTGTVIGLGAGQLVVGPLSDTLGRRRPLLVGLLGHVVTSAILIFTTSVWVMIGLRVLQGMCGAAVTVVVMAMIRDLFSGLRAVELLSRMALVTGLGPIVAPNIGGLILTVAPWPFVFVFLGVAGLGLLAAAWRFLPETLPPPQRLEAGLRAAVRAYRQVLGDVHFDVMLLVAAAGSITLFSYIAASSFVLQQGFGLGPQTFALVFAGNAVAMMVFSQLNPTLGRRFGPERVLMVSVAVTLVAAVAMFVLARTHTGGLAGFLAPTIVCVAMLGFNMANTTALAVENHARTAGTANALLGAGRFMIAGLVSPLVGALADGTAAPLGLVLTVVNAVSLALLIGVLLRRRARRSSE